MNFEKFSDVLDYMKEKSEKGWIIYMAGGRIYAVREGVVGKSFDNLDECKQFVEESDAQI